MTDSLYGENRNRRVRFDTSSAASTHTSLSPLSSSSSSSTSTNTTNNKSKPPKPLFKVGTNRLSSNYWNSDILIPECLSTRQLLIGFYLWKNISSWTQGEFESACHKIHMPITAKTSYGVFKKLTSTTPKRQLKSIENKLGCKAHISDIINKNQDYRHICFIAHSKEIAEMSITIFLQQLSEDLRLQVKLSGDMWGQMFQPTYTDYILTTSDNKTLQQAALPPTNDKDHFSNAFKNNKPYTTWTRNYNHNKSSTPSGPATPATTPAASPLRHPPPLLQLSHSSSSSSYSSSFASSNVPKLKTTITVKK